VNVPALGLLDTTAVTLADQLDPDQLPTEAVITAVTLLSCPWAHSPPTIPRERAIRQLRLQDVEANFAPCHSTPRRRARTAASRTYCVARAASRPRGRSTH